MTKFNVYKNSIEATANEIASGCTFLADNTDPLLLKSFDTEAEAVEYLKDKETEIQKVRNGLYQITELYVTEEKYNEEDGEYESSGDMSVASDIFQALLFVKRDLGDIPSFDEGDECELCDIWDGEDLPEEYTVYFQVIETFTGKSELRYQFEVLSVEDEEDHSSDLIKITSVERVDK